MVFCHLILQLLLFFITAVAIVPVQSMGIDYCIEKTLRQLGIKKDVDIQEQSSTRDDLAEYVEQTIAVVGDGRYVSDDYEDIEEEIIKKLRDDIKELRAKPHIMYMGLGTEAHAIGAIWPYTDWGALPTCMIYALNKYASSCKLWVIDYEWRRVGATGADCLYGIMNDRCCKVLNRSLSAIVGDTRGIFTLCKSYGEIQKHCAAMAREVAPAIKSGSVLLIGNFRGGVAEPYNSIFTAAYGTGGNDGGTRLIFFELPEFYSRGLAVWYKTLFNQYESEIFECRMSILSHIHDDNSWLLSLDKKRFMRFVKKFIKPAKKPSNDKVLLRDIFYKKLSCKHAPCDYNFRIAQDDDGRFYLQDDILEELDLLNISTSLREAYEITDEQVELLCKMCTDYCVSG
jgi:hypothetical protein